MDYQLNIRTEHPEGSPPLRWLAIAKHVPGRTNKDCRKRWCTKMLVPAVKGGWSPEEDTLLVKAIEKYGTNRWPLVSSMVGTRKSCQCARRWYDTLNPSIDRTPWSKDDDAKLLAAVNNHGKKWSYIAKTFFSGRTGLATKNRSDISQAIYC
ncbi:Homeodomain-like protein [Cyathus striatus]|nr:Homeodomain-like protein [Cyathus striatus]